MANEIKIRGKRCRQYHEGYNWIWVADTGDFVSNYLKGGKYKGSCRILKDHLGPFVKGKYGGYIYLEDAVMTCFGPPRPGKGYMLNHKDGNWMNCDYRNLEWAPYHYRNTTVPKVRFYYCERFLEVFSSGEVKDGGQTLHVVDYWYDPDVNLHWITPNPYIRVGSGLSPKRVEIENIMRACGYVQGDDAPLNNPVILHRDMDWKNFASDNLEWVEADDPRYQTYMNKKRQDMKDREKEMNGDKLRPDGWI